MNMEKLVKAAVPVLAAALVLGGCSKKAAETSSGPITLRVFQYELENQQMDFPNLWFYTELEKKTGIHVEWEPVKDADWKTRLNLMFASMDLPDIIRGEMDIEEYGVSQSLLVELDGLLETNMPNYYSRLHMNNANKAMPASNGKMYWIGSLIAQNINHDGNHYINKAWLDKLGLPIPTTIDELTQTLIAFRDRDPNGNGKKDEIPFSAAEIHHQTQGIYTHFANFGVPLQQFVYAAIDKNDKLIFPGYMEGFRPALEWLAMCFKERLLDMEAITQDSNAWGAKMNAGTVGYTTYLRLINTALTPETASQYVSIIPPASRYGVQVPRLLEVPSVSAALTVKNKHIPESLQWLDAQMETETMMVGYNGPIQPGGPIEPTMKINAAGKYEILYIPENNALYKYVPVYHAMFFAPGDYYFKIYEMPPHRVERFNTSRDYEEAGVLEPKSFTYLQRLVKPSSEEAVEISRLYNEIDKLMKESIANFIRGGVTDANWQAFLNSCKSIGVDRYIEIYQKAYDSYLAANK
jgi:putative aldouronate transport system substrate-binding protein